MSKKHRENRVMGGFPDCNPKPDLAPLPLDQIVANAKVLQAKIDAEFAYVVLLGDRAIELADAVNEWRGRGYKLQGGVSIATHGAGFRYAQAMVKNG